MADIFTLSAAELSALLCSRVCHDIISPVGAINNGLEVLAEDNNEEMREFAMDLIRKSARQASAKLQFARLAFGAAGSAGASIDLGDAENVAKGFMAGEKADITVAQQGGALVQMPAGTKLADVVKALNALGATPQDLLAILQAMKSAGALNADIEVI